MNAKSLFRSKTFYANLLGIALVIAGHYGVAPVEFSPEVAAVILGVLNLILRLVTRQPVYIK